VTNLLQFVALPGLLTRPASGLPGYPQSVLLTQAHGAWLEARGGAEMPTAQAMLAHPALEPMQPQVLLMAVEREPHDFRYVSVGSRMQQLSNSDYTGRLMSDIPHQRAPSMVWDHLTAAVDCRAPVKGVLPYVGRSRDITSIFHIVMPLAEDGERVDHLLVCVDLYQGVRLRDGTHPFTQLG